MLFGLTAAHWVTLHGFVTIAAVLIYIVTAHVLNQRRQPAAAIAWVLFIFLVPYVALPSFLMFGSRKLARPRALRLGDSGAGDARWAVRSAAALRQPAPVGYRELALHADGHAAGMALLQVIDDAAESIDVCTFIIGRDPVGLELLQRLAARARAGVRVRLLLDGLGHWMGGRPDLAPLRAAGAQVALFVPPLHSPLKGRTNLRNHRKLLIADAGLDSARLWTGGRNLATEYFEGDARHAAWHDLSFDLRGGVVAQAAALFEHDWCFALGQRLPPHAPPAPAPDAGPMAQIIASGPDQADDTVYALLLTGAYQARRRIAIATPYFVPDPALLLALALAARRGVTVDLLLPARSNHRMSDLARRRALRTLAAAGARLWLAPRMVHAKLIVIDDALALAGSANLDSRSLFLNYELMVAFHDLPAVQDFDAWWEHERRDAIAYHPRNPGLLTDVGEGLVLWLGFQL